MAIAADLARSPAHRACRVDARPAPLRHSARVAHRPPARASAEPAHRRPDVGTGAAAAQPGLSAQLAAAYLAAEFGDRPRHSWIAARVWAATSMLVVTASAHRRRQRLRRGDRPRHAARHRHVFGGVGFRPWRAASPAPPSTATRRSPAAGSASSAGLSGSSSRGDDRPSVARPGDVARPDAGDHGELTRQRALTKAEQVSNDGVRRRITPRSAMMTLGVLRFDDDVRPCAPALLLLLEAVVRRR